MKTTSRQQKCKPFRHARHDHIMDGTFGFCAIHPQLPNKAASHLISLSFAPSILPSPNPSLSLSQSTPCPFIPRSVHHQDSMWHLKAMGLHSAMIILAAFLSPRLLLIKNTVVALSISNLAFPLALCLGTLVTMLLDLLPSVVLVTCSAPRLTKISTITLTSLILLLIDIKNQQKYSNYVPRILNCNSN